jgi:hypothetical protein
MIMKSSISGRRRLILTGFGALAAQFRIAEADAQDAAQVIPRTYRVAFENEHVRVLDFTARPGMGICGEGTHSHPPGLTIAMTDWEGVGSTPGTGHGTDASPQKGRRRDVAGGSDAQGRKYRQE